MVVGEFPTFMEEFQYIVGAAEDFPEFDWCAGAVFHRLRSLGDGEAAEDGVPCFLMCRAVEQEVLDVTVPGTTVRALLARGGSVMP